MTHEETQVLLLEPNSNQSDGDVQNIAKVCNIGQTNERTMRSGYTTGRQSTANEGTCTVRPQGDANQQGPKVFRRSATLRFIYSIGAALVLKLIWEILMVPKTSIICSKSTDKPN